MPACKLSAALLRAWIVVAAASCLAWDNAGAQMGPVDTDGYVEYRFTQFGGEGVGTNSAHGLIAHSNFSTFFWRPWILNINGNLGVRQRRADARLGDETSSDVYGGVWLNFIPRSSFPLTIYYEDTDQNVDSEVNTRTGRLQRYGFRQQYSSQRLGNYSLQWRKLSRDTAYRDGFVFLDKSQNQEWEFTGRKGIGKNVFTLSSLSREQDSQTLQRHIESLRHSLRHRFRSGPAFDITNTVYYSGELLDSGPIMTDRVYRQLGSVLTWRPGQSRRFLLSGRGFLQDSEQNSAVGMMQQQSVSVSASARYQHSDTISMTGAFGFLGHGNGHEGMEDSSFQRLGLNYNAEPISLAGGSYNYFGDASIGNRTEQNEVEDPRSQDLALTFGHNFSRTLGNSVGMRWQLRASQQLRTQHDTVGRERNAAQHGLYLTGSSGSGRLNSYLRFSLLDQRMFADQRGSNLLANLQYSMRGRLGRNRSWNADASVQYSQRGQEKPRTGAFDSNSMSYSVSMTYRHSDLWNVKNLLFTSDLRWLSDDLRTDDPFDQDFDLDQERWNSSWRNRLDYRVGLLRLRADANLRDVNGNLSASVYLTIRRYFGMT